MSVFTIDMSSPFPPGFFTGGLGGPNSGGHHGTEWYIRYGMDLGTAAGTEVHAAFDGHITVLHPHNRSADTSKVYGAQLFMRFRSSATTPSFPDDKMGGFYTHITDVPASLRVGSQVSKGDLLGRIYAPAWAASHLHLALVEIIGGAPGGRYTGVDIYQKIQDIANTATVLSVTFRQDGSAPTVTP
jgi:murein DD-endopeptidase MepM/ murein hydrolase activator NlpD